MEIPKEKFLISKIINYGFKLKLKSDWLISILFGLIVTLFTILIDVFLYLPGEISYPTGFYILLILLYIAPAVIHQNQENLNNLGENIKSIANENVLLKLEEAKKFYYSQYYLFYLIPYLIVVIGSLYTFEFGIGYIWWIFLFGIFSYIAGIAIQAVLTNIILMKKISKLTLNLSPLNPDSFGGASKISNFLIYTTACFSTGALMIPLVMEGSVSEEIPELFKLIGIAVPFVFSFLVLLSFLVPLLSLTKIITTSKNKILQEYGKKYNKYLSRYLNEKNDEIKNNLVRELKVYESLFNLTTKLKNYPWDLGVITKLIASVLFPIIMGVIKNQLLSLIPQYFNI
ncbi:MAG: hypothetical protein ACTSYI_01495 [Promethearchaeota archaeon]